jgi:hypothetical protein
MQKSSDWLRQGYGEQTVPLQDSISNGMNQLTQQLAEAQRAANDPNQPSGANGDDKMRQALSEVQSLRQQLQAANQNGASGQNGQAQANSRMEGSQYAPVGGGKPFIGGGSSEPSVEDLSALRSALGRNDRILRNSFDNAIEALRELKTQKGLLDARINQDAVTSLERLELELARRANQPGSGARTGLPESAPEQYREALAEYYRQLSK